MIYNNINEQIHYTVNYIFFYQIFSNNFTRTYQKIARFSDGGILKLRGRSVLRYITTSCANKRLARLKGGTIRKKTSHDASSFLLTAE